ncbi:MAG TPA: penicillin-binding transpeptidase domain-containing protein [Anaerolineales bacterium]|jgi:penicillin-binding protein 2|nr:penicillin-binding transpeptidase domain-containing protein [Anaerolineales bacterium]HQX15670.1 penicillin-binding transpeptidase domain-containing protein [Anaerolineales bacterium]
MKLFRPLNFILIAAFILTACSSNGGVSIFPTETSLPQPVVTINSAPDAGAALTAYLDAYKADDYNAMYAMLSKVTTDALPLDQFAKRNKDALNEMSAGSFDYVINSALVNPLSAEVAYNVTYHTVLAGDIQRDMIARFTLEDGKWKLQWDDANILPELAGGNLLKMDYKIPSRGEIYDRNGEPFAAQSDVYAFYVIPGSVTDESIGTLAARVWALCGISPEVLTQDILNTPDQFAIPLCEASADESVIIRGSSPSGLQWEQYTSRYYFEQGTGSNVVGYTTFISAEDLDQYKRLGYQGSERVGNAGIERSMEDYLAGKHGGTLYVVNPSTGQIVTKVGESEPQPSESVNLTLDRNLQYYAEKSIEGFRGAVVVMEVDTGRVLAMSSSPDYDSNIFETNNPNSSERIAELFQRVDDPLLNRAAQGQYPLGSVFKIITMAAGMESGLYIPESTFDCQYDWAKLPDTIRHDWTWQHCQDRVASGRECNTPDSLPSGLLTLSQGLMRSCNPFFYDIGYTLYQNNRQTDIANMARAFGLGSPTGIGQITEAAGNISNPQTAIDVVNQAIGQGDMQVTPLQVARFIAALGNGGTLYRPQLVESIQPIEGPPTLVFKPEATGVLPVTPERLQLIREAMIEVVKNPLGTANFRLRGIQVPVAGKTGTAESGSGRPHAWFAGYTLCEEAADQFPVCKDKPDIAIVVVLENQGEGSDWAAPVFKRIIETYYFDDPQTIFWFESNFGVTETPTPFGGIPTETPKP